MFDEHRVLVCDRRLCQTEMLLAIGEPLPSDWGWVARDGVLPLAAEIRIEAGDKVLCPRCRASILAQVHGWIVEES